MRLAALGLICTLAACGPAEPPAAPPRPPPQPPPAPIEYASSKWGDFLSQRFNLRIPLPDGRVWRIDDHHGEWLSATHAPTNAELIVRVWTESDRMNRQRCEEKAREKKKLPDREGAEIVEKRPIAVPPDWDTVVEIGLVPPPKPSDPLVAFAMAFGGRARKCFAYVFTTSASGNKAEEIAGERLAAMTLKSLAAIQIRTELDPVVREGLEPSEPRPLPGRDSPPGAPP